jgi:uncharacterized protein (TIGR00369 family)
MSEATQLRDMMPFAVRLGIEIGDATAERVTARLAWAPHLCTTGAVLHGGALMALADSLGAVCAYLNLPPGAGTATISSSTNMMRAVRDGEVFGETRLLNAGRSVIVVETELRDNVGRLIAKVTQTQAVLSVAAQ